MCDDTRRMETLKRLFSLFKAIAQLYGRGMELNKELELMDREFLSRDSPPFPSEEVLCEALGEDFDASFVRECYPHISAEVDTSLPADEWIGPLRRIREGITRLHAAADDVHRQIDLAPERLLDDLRAPVIERWTFRLRTTVRQVVGHIPDPDVGKAVVMFVMDESARRIYINYNWNNFYRFSEDLTSLIKSASEESASQWAETSGTQTDLLEAARKEFNELKSSASQLKFQVSVVSRLRAMVDEGREFPGSQELSSELGCPADTVRAALDEDPALGRWSSPFFQVLKWAEHKIKGKQLRVIQLLAEQGGEMRIADIAVDSLIEWSGSVEQVKNRCKSMQREVNAKFHRYGIPWGMRRNGEHVYLEHKPFD